MLRSIEGYQTMFSGRPSPCRFFPSCSEYGHEAISVHGARRGLWLTVRRLTRCRPLGPSGYDPVPEGRPGNHTHSSSRLVDQRLDEPCNQPGRFVEPINLVTESIVMEKSA